MQSSFQVKNLYKPQTIYVPDFGELLRVHQLNNDCVEVHYLTHVDSGSNLRISKVPPPHEYSQFSNVIYRDTLGFYVLIIEQIHGSGVIMTM